MPTATITTETLVAWLSTRTRSGFAQSLVTYYRRNGRLTPNQERVARGMYDDAHQVSEMPAEVVGEACGNGDHSHCDHGNEDEARAANMEMAATPAPLVPGFYLLDGVLYRARYSQAGRLYAMRRGSEGGWEYERGAIMRLTADHKVTPEIAAEHGLRTGICLFCNAELDDRDGLGKRVGVGPVCCRKHLNMTQRQLAERLGV